MPTKNYYLEGEGKHIESNVVPIGLTAFVTSTNVMFVNPPSTTNKVIIILNKKKKLRQVRNKIPL